MYDLWVWWTGLTWFYQVLFILGCFIGGYLVLSGFCYTVAYWLTAGQLDAHIAYQKQLVNNRIVLEEAIKKEGQNGKNTPEG